MPFNGCRTRKTGVTGVANHALPVTEMDWMARKKIALIDALYEHKVKLLAAADAEPDVLYPEGDGRFEFQRTVSRLEEMRSESYLAEGHG